MGAVEGLVEGGGDFSPFFFLLFFAVVITTNHLLDLSGINDVHLNVGQSLFSLYYGTERTQIVPPPPFFVVYKKV